MQCHIHLPPKGIKSLEVNGNLDCTSLGFQFSHKPIKGEFSVDIAKRILLLGIVERKYSGRRIYVKRLPSRVNIRSERCRMLGHDSYSSLSHGMRLSNFLWDFHSIFVQKEAASYIGKATYGGLAVHVASHVLRYTGVIACGEPLQLDLVRSCGLTNDFVFAFNRSSQYTANTIWILWIIRGV
jgi:hypothetical protein